MPVTNPNTGSSLVLTDTTDNNATTLKHGFLSKLSGDANQFQNGQGNWTTPSGIVNSYVNQAFTSQTSVTIAHGWAGIPNTQVTLTNGLELTPLNVDHSVSGQVTFTFSESTSGKIQLTIGGETSTEIAAVALASAATTDIFNQGTSNINISGTTTITSFGTAPRSGMRVVCKATGNFTLAHSASLIGLRSANVLVKSGDVFEVISDSTTVARVIKLFNTDLIKVANQLVMSNLSTDGIKLNPASPDYGFKDLKGIKDTLTTGGSAPTREQFKTGVYGLAYNASDIIDWSWHVEHEDIAGGDKNLHVHISMSEGTVASGNNLILTAVIGHFYHNRTGSPSPITKTFTITPAELNACAKGTRVSEIVPVAQSGGGASLLDSDNLLIDDNLKASITFTQIPTLTGGLHQKLGFDWCDWHRKVTGLATKNKDMSGGSFHV